MAEALFRHLLGDREDYEVRSAGVAAGAGCSASPETLQALATRNISLAGFASQQVDEGLLDWATHVFTMTAGHLSALERLEPQAARKAYVVTEFARDGAFRNQDVPDPIGLGAAAYEETYHTLSMVLPDVLAFIEQTTTTTKPDNE